MRPEESLSANTRLFFWVYREIGAEKTKTGYKLKVVHIGTYRLKETPLIREHSNRRHRDVHIAEFMIYVKHSVALELLSIIFVPFDFFCLERRIVRGRQLLVFGGKKTHKLCCYTGNRTIESNGREYTFII